MRSLAVDMTLQTHCGPMPTTTIRRAIRIPAVATLVAHSALATPTPAQAKPDTVSLRFGWPVGMMARVEQEWTRIQISPQRRDSAGVRSRYRLTVSSHPKGRLIQSDSFVVTSAPPASGRRGALDAQQFLARLGSVSPSYVVSTDGEFIGVEGIERTKQAIDSLFAPLLRGMADAPPQFKALMQSATSVQALTAAAAQEWNVVAGTWIGADWEVGEAYGAESEEPSPMFPGLKIPMQHEFSAAERVPCNSIETGRRCVRLEMVSEPDSAALRRALSEFMTRLAPKEATAFAGLRSTSMVNELTVVVDPRDLRPYSVMLTKRIDMDVAGPGGPGGKTTRVDIRSARYTYVR